jgi:hypothetical protein
MYFYKKIISVVMLMFYGFFLSGAEEFPRGEKNMSFYVDPGGYVRVSIKKPIDFFSVWEDVCELFLGDTVKRLEEQCGEFFHRSCKITLLEKARAEDRLSTFFLRDVKCVVSVGSKI